MARVSGLAPERARGLAPVPVPGPARALERALAQASGQARALATASWVMERSGRVRRFHKLPLPGPKPRGIPLIAKCVERWTT